MKRVRWTVAVGLWLALASGVQAEPAPDKARAEQLFEEARVLLAQKQYAPACAKLQESLQLDRQLGTQLHLGHCHEKQGDLLRAHRAFQGAAELAAARNREGAHEAREAVARERAASLEPRLSILELRLAEPSAELQVELDGAPLARSELGRPIPKIQLSGTVSLLAQAPAREAGPAGIVRL